MKRKTQSFKINNPDFIIKQAISWASGFSHYSYFKNNNVPYLHGPFPHLLAVGAHKLHSLPEQPFENLYHIHQASNDWLFGYFTYDIKNEIHNLKSIHPDSVKIPCCTFYQPLHIIEFQDTEIKIHSKEDPVAVFKQLTSSSPILSTPEITGVVESKMSRHEYIERVNKIKDHILEGDCYELNLCMEFILEGISGKPEALFFMLDELSPMPFASLQRYNDSYLLCASPERFLKKEGNKLISQPIKGTIRRGITPEEDEQLKVQLRHDEKELAENMMIVDLVRNDLAMSSKPGSVKVEELFGIYSFRQVHQMISTVTSEIKNQLPFTQAIKNAFPMGSMTGAPKKKVMELIEKYEKSKRGLYSGSVGFIKPDGDFDFNVVIRSMIYNASLEVLSYQVGSAITYDAIAEKEYEECLLKAAAIKQILEKLAIKSIC